MGIKKGHHCAYDTHFHIVFPTKYRKALLSDKIKKYLQEITMKIEERYDLEIERLGCDIDHVHILCSLHPKYSQGDFVRLYKSITAREIFKKFPEVKKDLWGGEFWSDGYYVATVGTRGNWDVVKKYVENQGRSSKEAQLELLYKSSHS